MAREAGQIEVRLFIRGQDNNEFHVGDFGNASCKIDLKEYSFFLFTNKKDPKDRTLIIRQKENS